VRVTSAGNGIRAARFANGRALPVAEQDGMSNFSAGAIRLHKNPQSHRNLSTKAIDAAEINCAVVELHAADSKRF